MLCRDTRLSRLRDERVARLYNKSLLLKILFVFFKEFGSPTVFLLYQTKIRSDAVVEDVFFGFLGAVGVQDIIQGDVPHEIPDAFIEVLPDAAGGTEFAAFAFFGALDAVHDGEGAFHDLQYLQQRDFFRILGQMVAAVHAAHRADQAPPAQADHQTADVFF